MDFDIIVDFHVHLVDYETYCPWVSGWHKGIFKERYDEIFTKNADPVNFVAMLKEAHIDYAVIFSEYAPITTGICTNEQVEKFCAGQPSLIPFCNINPFLIARGADELEVLVEEKGFKGLKLYPTYNYFYPNEPMLYPIYAKCEQLGVPLIFHTGSSIFRSARLKYGNPLYIDDLAVDFPNLTIIMAHSGRGFWYQKAFFLAQLHRNVYMEVSGLPAKNLLKYFPDLEKNAHKILYGSDFPGLPVSFKENLDQFFKMPISHQAKKMILGENAAKILGLKK